MRLNRASCSTRKEPAVLLEAGGAAPRAGLLRTLGRPAPVRRAAAAAGSGDLSGSSDCSTSGRSGLGALDAIDAEWAAFPKPGVGRFYRPSAAPRAAYSAWRDDALAAAATGAPGSSEACCSSMAVTEHWDHDPWDHTAAEVCDPLLRLEEVFVILFGADGPAEGEGIYSLRVPEPDGLPHDTIIAFESRVDAERYCGFVEAAMEVQPCVCGLPPSELATFCRDHGYHCRLELKGSLLMPPDRSVGMTDWERAERLRQGTGFRVLSDEPQLPAPAARQAPIELPLPRQPQLPVRLPPCSTEGQVLPRSGEFSRDQMASIVAALEALLPSGASTPSSASNAPTPLDSDVEGKCL